MCMCRHLKPALGNFVSLCNLPLVILHCALYCSFSMASKFGALGVCQKMDTVKMKKLAMMGGRDHEQELPVCKA